MRCPANIRRCHRPSLTLRDVCSPFRLAVAIGRTVGGVRGFVANLAAQQVLRQRRALGLLLVAFINIYSYI